MQGKQQINGDNHMTLGQILRYVRKKRGHTLSDVVKGVNYEVTESQISKVERDAQDASLSFVKLVTNFLDMPMDILDGRPCDEQLIDQLLKRHVGFESLVTIGKDGYLKINKYSHLINDVTERHVKAVVYSAKNTFIMEVESNDMESSVGGTSFERGSIVYADPKLSPRTEDFVVVKHDNRVIIKQLQKIDGRFVLKSLNVQYPIVEMTEESEIIGVIVAKLTSHIDLDNPRPQDNFYS